MLKQFLFLFLLFAAHSRANAESFTVKEVKGKTLQEKVTLYYSQEKVMRNL